jgi:hypothetical protein
MLRQAQHDYEILFSRLKKLFTPNKSFDLQGVIGFLLILSWTEVITNSLKRNVFGVWLVEPLIKVLRNFF